MKDLGCLLVPLKGMLKLQHGGMTGKSATRMWSGQHIFFFTTSATCSLKIVPKSSDSTSNNFGIDSDSIFLNLYHRIQIMKCIKDVVKRVGRYWNTLVQGWTPDIF